MSQSLVLEAQDGTCGYLDGVRPASYGCQAITQKCALYYPTSTRAADDTGIIDLSAGSTCSATPSFKTLTRRADRTNAVTVTSAPRVDSPAVVCCDSSTGNCTTQPTACVDAFNHSYRSLCTGDCLNDPMTLKCTAGDALHCNQFRVQSPLYYRRSVHYNGAFGALEARIGVAGQQVHGWFYGNSAMPTRTVESTTISRGPVSEDESSNPVNVKISTTLPGYPASQFTTVPFTSLATTTITRAAAPVMTIKGFAVLSTTYVNQSGRSLFTEATRSWEIVVPTPASNITATSKINTSLHHPRLPEHTSDQQHDTVYYYLIIVGGAAAGIFAICLLIGIIYGCRKLRERRAEKFSGNEGEGIEGVNREGGDDRPRPDRDSGRSAASPRDGDHPQISGPVTRRVSSPSGDSAVEGLD